MAKEYIEREAVLMKIMQDGTDARTIGTIAKAPAADVVEVVRCKDCKYQRLYDDGVWDCAHLDGLTHTRQNYFCSYGERKDVQ